MKNQSDRRRQIILSAAIVIIIILGASLSAFAQKGIGAKYGSRDPRPCADKTSPKTGALSAAKAAEYVTCENERAWSEYLYFVDDVKVQVGAGRRYNPAEDINFSGIDTKFPIYPIRGSYKSYQCTKIFPDQTNLNRNCNLIGNPDATGACYRKEFGEWRCLLTDIRGEVIDAHAAPPGAAKQNPAAGDRKTQTENARQTTNLETAVAVNAANGFPKPDFSEMEDWFDIVRYEYPKAPDRNLIIYFKPKVDGSKRPYIFYVEFRDKDGIPVQSADASPMCCSSELMETAIGETAKVRVQIPAESIMKQVAGVKIIRAK